MSRQTMRKAHNFTRKLQTFMKTHDMCIDHGTVPVVVQDVHPHELQDVVEYASDSLEEYPISFARAYKYNKNDYTVTFYVTFQKEEFDDSD